MKVFVDKAVKKYNNNVVLNIDNLNLEDGKIYAVIGLNGSGKTTLMESIAGLRSLSSGTLKYNNLNLEDVRSHISIMLQSNYLFTGSVLSNIICGLKFRKYKDEEIKKRLDKYRSVFNIEELLNKNCKKLSGGEQEKVCLLRTAILETNLTIFDEPTSSMDIESTLIAEELIKNMAKGQRTVVVVTHDIYQAKRIADEVIFMDSGKVIEIGKKEDIFNNPKHNLIKAILNI
ncbi:ATP-binding cassette domain-containing protein [Candidatus Clostridium stratigraminis]|uniref:ATP-binding cassette domain-containing protein n=1 Tax=Candidatus Clostridium stratigraminis TaxID=3381661 RepID=A0ABW8T290_9CLOT